MSERQARQFELAANARASAVELANLLKARGIRPNIVIEPIRKEPQPEPEKRRRLFGRSTSEPVEETLPRGPLPTHWIVTSKEEVASSTPLYDPDRAAGTAPFAHISTFRTYGVAMDAAGLLWRYRGPKRADSLTKSDGTIDPPRNGRGLIITGPASSQLLAPVEIRTDPAVFTPMPRVFYVENPMPEGYPEDQGYSIIGPTTAPLEEALVALGARLLDKI